jgi:DNA-binding NarL/FixJ family response regulator
MTRLLFLPDDQTLVVLESPLAAGDLVELVNQGRWIPPAPYDQANPANSAVIFQAARFGDQGRTVVISPCLPVAEIRRLLKPRQRQILLMLAHGLTNKEIAVRLKLHPRTVALHIAALNEFFGARSRAQSVRKAVEMGLIED